MIKFWKIDDLIYLVGSPKCLTSGFSLDYFTRPYVRPWLEITTGPLKLQFDKWRFRILCKRKERKQQLFCIVLILLFYIYIHEEVVPEKLCFFSLKLSISFDDLPMIIDCKDLLQQISIFFLITLYMQDIYFAVQNYVVFYYDKYYHKRRKETFSNN